jgi:hypothetical protein
VALDHHDHRQPAIQGVQAGEELSTRRLRLFHRTHAAQQHRRVQERIAPLQVLVSLVNGEKFGIWGGMSERERRRIRRARALARRHAAS